MNRSGMKVEALIQEVDTVTTPTPPSHLIFCPLYTYTLNNYKVKEDYLNINFVYKLRNESQVNNKRIPKPCLLYTSRCV